MPNITIENIFSNLKDNIKKYEKAAIAFSGGVDSTFLLAVCVEILGKDNIIAITAFSETYTESELKSATALTNKLGVHHVITETEELNDPEFLNNPVNRCYLCKKSFYSKVFLKLNNMGFSVIFDGTNSDDSSDYRPGRIAAKEFGIISPLLEEGLSKNDIRTLSKNMNLPTWNKPANPCLASRIPYGSMITKEKLQTIEKAEGFIHSLGFETVRLRHHNETARIEISPIDLSRFMQDDTRKKVNQYLKSLDFTWITLDIGGYRTGSLNRNISTLAATSGTIL
jgi:pyridinium-3,5-biscarboxylic acid mononucleotide sulfurtransferase